MTFSGDGYEQTYDTNTDGSTDLTIHYKDWDTDGIPHAVSAEMDTDFNGITDTFVELNPADNTVVSVRHDVDEDGRMDVAYTPDGQVIMADIDGDGTSSYQEVSLAQSGLDELSNV